MLRNNATVCGIVYPKNQQLSKMLSNLVLKVVHVYEKEIMHISLSKTTLCMYFNQDVGNVFHSASEF